MNIAPPVRVRRTYTQHLAAPRERVFPLLCPVRKRDWIPGRKPIAVYANSGLAEQDCVFITIDEEDREAVWVTTRYDPARYVIEFVKLIPDLTAASIRIRLESVDKDSTEAEVTYQHTALSKAGEEFVAAFTEEYYEGFMRDWEDSLNHYLRTGQLVENGETQTADSRSSAS